MSIKGSGIFGDDLDEEINRIVLDVFKSEGIPEDKFSDIFGSAIETALPQSAERILSILKDGTPWLIKLRHRDRNNFEKRLRLIWGHALTLTEMFLHISIEAGDWINKVMREHQTSENYYLIEVLTRLHGRSCQVTGEVLCLLNAGYASGAITRWRTLHEITVVIFLISEYGNDLAKRYMDHKVILASKASRDYQHYAGRLGETPLTENETMEIENQRQELRALYGSDFDTQYGWAASIIKEPLKGKKRITFRDLEKIANIDHLRPYYQLASNSVHSNVNCIMSNIDLMPDNDIILAGPSNYGLIDPCQNTVLSLYQINVATMLSLEPSFSNLLILKTMDYLLQDISNALCEGNDRLNSI